MSRRKSFQMYLELIEFEPRIPSMNVRVDIDIHQARSAVKHSSAFWFDCFAWDIFVKNLRSTQMLSASLVDLNNCFTLSLSLSDGQPYIRWQVTERDVALRGDFGRAVTTCHNGVVDPDDFENVRQTFFGYGRWW